ncbi:MAG: diaminopimelate epimerase [Vicingaceae bacterium]
MKISFFKYQGTGNDFVMIDGREKELLLTKKQIEDFCDRRFGIGADGVIILKNQEFCDFEMDYYNADGTQSFCGNGSRCAQAFAKKLGIIHGESHFKAIDGFHHGKTVGQLFATQMKDVNEVQQLGDDYFIHTGSPHYIKYVDDVEKVDVEKEGAAIRNSAPYKMEGVNVNFVSISGNTLKVRTFERGVEGETYSCGTGVTAVAMSFLVKENAYHKSVSIETKGGELKIDLDRIAEHQFENVWLIGPAEEVYAGTIGL